MIVHKERPDEQIGHIDIDITAEFADEMEDVKELIRSNPTDAVKKVQEMIDAMVRHLENK